MKAKTIEQQKLDLLTNIPDSMKRIVEAVEIRRYFHDAVKHGFDDADIVRRIRESLAS